MSRTRLAAVAALAFACATGAGGSAMAQGWTTFRVVEFKELAGDKLEVTLGVHQGSSAAPINFYLHGANPPKHRDYACAQGERVEEGMPLGDVTPVPAGGTDVMHKVTLSLKELESDPRVGVGRGGTVHFALKLPAEYNSGHEWGCSGYGGDYTNGTALQIPEAKQNSFFARRAQVRPLWLRSVMCRIQPPRASRNAPWAKPRGFLR